MQKFEEAQRLLKLPIYVFAQADKLKAEKAAQGVDLIDMGMGNPDIPPPKEAIATLVDSLKNPEIHRYPSFEGAPEFKEAVAGWCKKQYDINIDPDHEVVTLIGSKEGVVHFTFAYVNPGDFTLVPMPAYPAHFRGTILAGGEAIALPTTEHKNYLPDLKIVVPGIADKAKIMFLSFPTNPTGALAPREFFEEAVAFCKKHNIILVHDFAYAEIYFNGQKPLSIFSIPGAKDIAIEFHTTSKTFGMPGWRCGFAVGNRALIESLRKIKTNLDYGLFTAVQKAAITAFNQKNGYIDQVRATYQRRRDVLVDGLNALGWKIKKPKGSMYVWIPVPQGFDSTEFTMHLVDKTGVVVSPGVAFGDIGEGYVRAALVVPEDRICQALERMEKAGIKYNG
ncbi:MAG: LL-diaminopimelate aminotransferase [Candidatus Margulisbacteria bacterium]|nr:LL-diaminopimelate aminotransferase [Candidatus Margulisiibacteriota bacterium]MBU1617283.1 LL-diaminopimelate aminotransferase [Candidatus Margulisiibacteriota bacterium]MBU1867075.1 LL-diaminopimelate aminotransferase [Candidatus Margulisiibacteriota bacterium]